MKGCGKPVEKKGEKRTLNRKEGAGERQVRKKLAGEGATNIKNLYFKLQGTMKRCHQDPKKQKG